MFEEYGHAQTMPILEQASEIVRYHSPGILSKVDLIDIN